MNIETQNGYLILEFLSNIELYFSPSKNIFGKNILIDGDEFLHVTKVMRHKIGNELFSTDGEGNIHKSKILKIQKNRLEANIIETFTYKNDFENICFCIPKLKNADRFEFALEKSVELGITSFIIFESSRTISKTDKGERWNKILLSAMKQSLRSFLPKLRMIDNLNDILNLEGSKFIFDQKSKKRFKKLEVNLNERNYFVFGPEGGLTEKEMKLFNDNNFYNLAENRLRTETAVIKCASILNG